MKLWARNILTNSLETLATQQVSPVQISLPAGTAIGKRKTRGNSRNRRTVVTRAGIASAHGERHGKPRRMSVPAPWGPSSSYLEGPHTRFRQDSHVTAHTPDSRLARRLGVGGATAVGLGAMLGTGVFAAWTPAVRTAGSLLLVALVIAAVVAVLNAWSSVRLAAAHPVSGGSYAYGRRWRGRAAGLTAGYAFVIGKSASAGAAALTIAAYVAPGQQRLIAAAAVAIVLLINVRGVATSAAVSAGLSAFVIAVLVALVVVTVYRSAAEPVVTEVPSGDLKGLLEASAVLFVAFAGYARVTVLGEEVRDPRRVIPRAIAVSLLVTLVLYAAVAVMVMGALARGVVLTNAPLAAIAQSTGGALTALVPIGAVVAAGAALLSLVAGVGRTLFAMASHGDAPRALARVSARRAPVAGEIAAAVLVLIVVAVGGIGGALALSAGSIGIYYSVAHLSAMKMVAEEQPPPRWVPIVGLLGCAVLVAGAVLTLSA